MDNNDLILIAIIGGIYLSIFIYKTIKKLSKKYDILAYSGLYCLIGIFLWFIFPPIGSISTIFVAYLIAKEMSESKKVT